MLKLIGNKFIEVNEREERIGDIIKRVMTKLGIKFKKENENGKQCKETRSRKVNRKN
jgi:hypothetical protein